MTLIRHEPTSSTGRRGDLIDVFERVLREGGVFEIAESLEPDHDRDLWFKVAVAGVHVLKVRASRSWRRLLEGDPCPGDGTA